MSQQFNAAFQENTLSVRFQQHLMKRSYHQIQEDWFEYYHMKKRMREGITFVTPPSWTLASTVWSYAMKAIDFYGKTSREGEDTSPQE